MARLPKTCTLSWTEAMEANKEKKGQLRITIKRAVRKKYRHCMARGSKPTLAVRENYCGEPYVKVSNLSWGRQLSYKELYPEYPKLVKETTLPIGMFLGNTSGESLETRVKNYLKNTYKHYLAKGNKLDIKVTSDADIVVKNIKWGRMLSESEM